MKPLFSSSGRRVLDKHLSKPTFFIFDFDGVLAPLIAARHSARPPKSTLKRLRALVKQAPVAVVTGRALSDVKKHLHFRPKYVVGNHGIEGLPEFRKKMKGARQITAEWKSQLLKHHAIFEAGGELENKDVSLTLHFRRASQPERARRAILRAISQLRPKPRVVLGKKVFNLVVKGTPHKGDAVARLMKRVGRKRATYIADDVTDEDVFRLKDKRLFCVRVGKKRGSAAKYFVPDQTHVDAFLDILLSSSRSNRK